MVDASSLVIPAFHDVLGDVMAHGHTHYWLHGGRGSTKSSFISVCIVLLLLAHPEANAVVVRRFSNTLRDSVFSQMTWAIAALGLDAWFRARISPMELTYLPTGQRIVFRGADDPLKLKGVKFVRGYAAVVWFEELDQFDGIDAVCSILNSLRRGGDDFWIFYSYNPPRTLWSWVNREGLERERRADTLVRQSESESPPFPLTHRVPFGHDAVNGERGHWTGYPPPRYSAEFKQQAVRPYRERGGTYAEIAREPGVDPGSLSDWARRADAAQAPAGDDPFQMAEGLRGLGRGNERPKRENEIPLKASAFFAGRQL